MYIVVVIGRLKGKSLLISSSEAILKGEEERERETKAASMGSSFMTFKLGAHELYFKAGYSLHKLNYNYLHFFLLLGVL